MVFHAKFEIKISITKDRKENISFSDISGFLLLLSPSCIDVGNAWCVCSAGALSIPAGVCGVTWCVMTCSVFSCKQLQPYTNVHVVAK